MSPDGSLVVTVSRIQAGGASMTGTLAVWRRNATLLYEYILEYDIVDDIVDFQLCYRGETAVSNLVNGTHYRIAVGCPATTTGALVFYDFGLTGTITFVSSHVRDDANDGVNFGNNVDMTSDGTIVVCSAVDAGVGSEHGAYFFYSRTANATLWTTASKRKPVSECDSGPASTSEIDITGYQGAFNPNRLEYITGGYDRSVAVNDDDRGRFWSLEYTGGSPLFGCDAEFSNPMSEAASPGYGLSAAFSRNPYTERDVLLAYDYKTFRIHQYVRNAVGAAWADTKDFTSTGFGSAEPFRIVGCSSANGVIMMQMDAKADLGGFSNNGIVSVAYQRNGLFSYDNGTAFNPDSGYTNRYLGGEYGTGIGCGYQTNRIAVGRKFSTPNVPLVYIIEVDETLYFNASDALESPDKCPYVGFPCNSSGNLCVNETVCLNTTGIWSCGNGSAIECDDGDACTADSCDNSTGCVYTSTTSLCDDSNNCTTDSCDLSLGCVYTAIVGCLSSTVESASVESSNTGWVVVGVAIGLVLLTVLAVVGISLARGGDVAAGFKAA